MNSTWKTAKVCDFFNVTNGKTNTDDAIKEGAFPLFDRSAEVKRSDKFLFDTEVVIIPGEGKEFIPRYFDGKFDLHQRAYAISPKKQNDVNAKYLYFWLFFNRNYLSKMA